MINKLYPRLYVPTLLDIPLEVLEGKGIKAFILDLDNTITEWNNNSITEEVRQWFTMVKAAGFKACILSNNGEQRVLQVAESLAIPYICKARKPRRGGYYQAVARMEVKPEETAVIGDQIFTDVWGGNRAGLFTILVIPLSNKEFMGTKISRALEYFVLRRIKKHNSGL